MPNVLGHSSNMLTLSGNIDSYRDLSYPVVSERSEEFPGVWFKRGSFEPAKEIIIGHCPNSKKYFILCDHYEFFPGNSYHSPKYRKSPKSTLKANFFIRIRGLLKADIEEFKHYLYSIKGTRFASNPSGILQVLKTGLGISVIGKTEGTLNHHDFLFSVLKNGLKRNQRRIPVEFVSTSRENLYQVFNDLKKIDLASVATHSFSKVHYFLIRKLFPSFTLN